MGYVYWVLQTLIMFCVLVPIRYARRVPYYLERLAIRFYYLAAVARRRSMGEETWKEIDFHCFGILPPKGHPWHEKRAVDIFASPPENKDDS